MMRFRFRLERFLELRRHRERECEMVLARALGQCLLIKRTIAEIDGELAASIGRVTRDGNLIDARTLNARDLYAQRLRRDRGRAEKELEEKNGELAEARDLHHAAQRDRKVLEKLRERREAEYYRLRSIEEYRTIDDLHTSAGARRDAFGESADA